MSRPVQNAAQRLVRRLVLVVLLSFPAAVEASGQRLALVVGINGYENITPLQTAVNDARAVGAALESQGYRVTLRTRPAETTQEVLQETIARFASEVDEGDVALVFFAGHGIEIEGRNHLIPADAPTLQPDREGAERMLETRSLSVGRLLDDLRARAPSAVVLILDACRDNPFPRAGTRSLGGARGLAGMQPESDVFVLYSAGVGQTALDRLSDRDADPNSVFTRALLPLLSQSGLHPADVARRLRGDVRTLAASIEHQQSPAYYDQIDPDFVLIEGSAAGGAAVEDEVDEPAVAPVTEETAEDPGCGPGNTDGCTQMLIAAGAAPMAPEQADAMIGVVFDPALTRQEAAAAIHAALTQGMGRDLVRALQRRLAAEAGYTGGIDGSAGRQTRAALDRWANAQPDFATPLVADWTGVADWSGARLEVIGALPGREGLTGGNCLVATNDGAFFLGDQRNLFSPFPPEIYTRIIYEHDVNAPIELTESVPLRDCPTAVADGRAVVATVQRYRQQISGFSQGGSELIQPWVTLWNLSDGTQIAQHNTRLPDNTNTTVALSGDGQFFVVWQRSENPHQRTMQLWRVAGFDPVAQWTVSLTEATQYQDTVAFSPDTQRVAYLEGAEIIVRNTADGAVVSRIDAPHTDGNAELSWLGDSSGIVWAQLYGREVTDTSGFNRKHVVVLDARTGATLAEVFDALADYPIDDNYNGVRLSPDGRLIAVWNPLSGVHLWDLAENRLIAQFDAGEIRHIVFSPDGSLILILHQGGVDLSLWRSDTGGLLRRFADPYQGTAGDDWLLAPVFAPDGETIYALSHNFSAFRWRRE